MASTKTGDWLSRVVIENVPALCVLRDRLQLIGVDLYEISVIRPLSDRNDRGTDGAERVPTSWRRQRVA